MDNLELKRLFRVFAKNNGYSETPPDIYEFISDPYFIGNSTHNGSAVYPYWKDKLSDIYPTPFFEHNKYKILLFSSAIGTGKTTVAQIICLYDLCRILCLESPQLTFKLPKSSKMFLMLSNSTIENAEQINLDPIISIIRDSPFFRSKFNKNQKMNYFINNIDIAVASRKRSLVGKNVFGALSDEINVEVNHGASKELVTEMYNRINSRFILQGNKWPCHYCLVSSATTESSLIQTFMDNNADKNEVKILGDARYIVKNHLNIYSGQKFKIFVGDYQSDPFFITNNDDLKRAESLDITKIYEVPIEHREEFSSSIYDGIRDVIGVAISDSRTFIPFKQKIQNVMQLTKACNLDEIIIDELDDTRIIDYFDTNIIKSFKPGSEKVIGIDIAVSGSLNGGDRLGIAMVHINDTKNYKDKRETKENRENQENREGSFDSFVNLENPNISKLNKDPDIYLNSNKVKSNQFNQLNQINQLSDLSDLNDTKELNDLRELVYWVDFAVSISPKKGQRTPLNKIREFINDLRQLNICIKIVCMDTFQSFDMAQQLNKMGISSRINSVDTKKEPYLAFRNAIYEERVFMPNNKLLYNELVNLKETNKKIDHPEFFSNGTKGSKDIADAVCNALYIASKELSYNPLRTENFREKMFELLMDPRELLKEKLFG